MRRAVALKAFVALESAPASLGTDALAEEAAAAAPDLAVAAIGAAGAAGARPGFKGAFFAARAPSAMAAAFAYAVDAALSAPFPVAAFPLADRFACAAAAC